MVPHTVPLHAAHARLDLIDYLCLLWPDRARRTIHDLFARGVVRSRGQPVSPRRRVGELADLVLHTSLSDVPSMFPDREDDGATRDFVDNLASRILHEDARLVVLQKPAGLAVIPDRTRDSGSCLEALTRCELRSRPEKPVAEYLRYRIVHRLDRLTSGLLIVAKTPEAERLLSADLEARRVEKEYLALLGGRVAGQRIVVPSPIGAGRKGKMRVVQPGTPGAKEALTVFDVLERFDDMTLVRATPKTGRQHQIRVHAWAMGHPLAVDPLYAVGSRALGHPVPGIERLTLHAHRYTLPPSWEEPRSFSCPLADDFQRALEALRRGKADP